MVNSNEYMREYMHRRYHQRRELAFEYLGGECVVCGSTASLEIDHIERENRPNDKKFARFWNMALDRFYRELDFCQLLCYEHHLEKTKQDLALGHGGGVSGKRNCPCVLCKERKSDYMKHYVRCSQR